MPSLRLGLCSVSFRSPNFPKAKIAAVAIGSPNIALNVRDATVDRSELWACAVFGTILQLSALTFPAASTYQLSWRKGGSSIAAYGYPCFAIGTTAVCLGLIFCGRVIEGGLARVCNSHKG